MNKSRISRYLSLVLRHHPEAAGISLDRHGWAEVSELLAGVSRKYPIDRELLDEIVAEDEKQRYSYSPDGTKIRASQGHSIPVDVEFKRAAPPEYLWHGTGEKSTASIDRQGLLPMERLYVHLSPDPETAVKVGRRHGRPVVYRISSGKMAEDGIPFWRSENGVWLVKNVPVKYLRAGIGKMAESRE